MAALPTQERLRAFLAYDPDTGEFTWLRKAARNTRIGSVAGRVNSTGYVEIGLDGRLHHAHRLAWVYLHGGIPDSCVIDHANGVRDDNSARNLRAVSVSLNNRNRHRPAGRNTFVGVSWEKARCKWRADIKIGAKCKTLGRFDSEEEARAAYVAARNVIWPELAKVKPKKAAA